MPGAAAIALAYADEHLLVIDKPAGLVVHPARGHREGTLAQLLAGELRGGSDPERPGIVHRLDRDTSGLLVVARSEHVHQAAPEGHRPADGATGLPDPRSRTPTGSQWDDRGPDRARPPAPHAYGRRRREPARGADSVHP